MLLCYLTLALAADVAPQAVPTPPARIELHVEPVVDAFFHVRWLAARPNDSELEPSLRAAAASARALAEELGGALAWGPIEGTLAACTSFADLRAGFETLPAEREVRPGKSVRLRERALELAELLVAAEASFTATVWPAHQALLTRARADFERTFVPRERELLDFHLKALALEPKDLVIPCFFVVHAPAPGAVTHRGAGGRGVCFVAVHDVSALLLAETVLHEATHALDVACASSVFAELRAALAAKGLSAREREFRDVPHTLMFIQAGETIRRVLDEKHVHYGDASGYYAKVELVAKLERELWCEHLDGKRTRAATVSAIVERACRK